MEKIKDNWTLSHELESHEDGLKPGSALLPPTLVPRPGLFVTKLNTQTGQGTREGGGDQLQKLPSPRILYIDNHVVLDRDNCVSSFFFCVLLFFSYFIAPAVTSSTIKKGDGHGQHFSCSRSRKENIHSYTIMGAVGFLSMSSVRLRNFPSIPGLLRISVFIMNGY